MSVELDGKAEDIKVEDTKAEDTKAEDTKAEDTKAEDTKAEDTKVDDTSDNKESPSEGVEAKAEDDDNKENPKCKTCLGHIYHLVQLIYWRILIIVIGLVQLCAMILYGGELLNQSWKGQCCFAWFATITAISVFQIPIHMLILIPGRYSKASYDRLIKTKYGRPLLPEYYYPAVSKCNYCLLYTVISNWCFLAGVYEQYIFPGIIEPEFGALFMFSSLMYTILLTVRIVSILVDVYKETFYNPFWDQDTPGWVKVDEDEEGVTALYSTTFEVTFNGVCKLWTGCDLGMICFSLFLTYAISDYTSETDLIQNFYEVWHPCILIDHFPSSLAGITLIGVREIFGCIFSLLMFMFVWKKSGIEETLICGAFLTVGQLFMFCIVNAFSAQLYRPGEIVALVGNETAVVLDMTDRINAKEHTIAYLMWLIGNVIVFYYSYRMLKRYKAPLGNPPGPSLPQVVVKIFWWGVYWIGSNFIVITISAAMFVTIINTNISWARDPHGFIQGLLGFLWFSVAGINRYIGMLVAPMQRFIFPPGMGLRFTVMEEKSDKINDGSIGRGSKLFTAALFVLFSLVVGTNMWGTGDNSALLPLVQGFRVKPWVFVFAPSWLANCILIGYAFIVTGYQLACGKMNSNYLFFFQLVSAVFLLFFFLQLFVVIPFWNNGPFLAICLSLTFITWVVVAQKCSWQSIIWVTIGIVISIFGLNFITDANLSNWVGVGSILYFMTYSSLFPGDTQLFVKIETIPPTGGWLEEDEKDNETEKTSCCCNC